jgi:hypothetical protein
MGIMRILITICILLSVTNSRAEWLDNLITDFEKSDFIFSRSNSNVPFIPVAFLSYSHYNQIELKANDVVVGSFDQQSISQGSGIPFLLGPRDALVIGEYIGWNRFDSNSNAFQSFEVTSFGLPIGWVRQANPDRQIASFVMPFAHWSSLPGSDLSVEYMGGVFDRHIERDDFWWAYGLFFEIGPEDEIFLPYFGASWEPSEKWTISAVMPWPSVMYAPDKDTFYSLGAMPSGASWGLTNGQNKVFNEFNTWDFGLTAEKRLQDNLWLKFEAGIGGLRSLYIRGSDVNAPEFDIDSSPYLSIGINFRP